MAELFKVVARILCIQPPLRSIIHNSGLEVLVRHLEGDPLPVNRCGPERLHLNPSEPVPRPDDSTFPIDRVEACSWPGRAGAVVVADPMRRQEV